MEYRNSGNASHLGKGLAFSVDADAGVEILGSTIAAIGDTTASNLTVKAKGTGTVTLGDSSQAISVPGTLQTGGSTTTVKLMSGESSFRPPALSSFAQDYSTFALAPPATFSTGDLIVGLDMRGTLSTVYLVGTGTILSASDARVQIANVHNSSVSGSSGRLRWTILKRT